MARAWLAMLLITTFPVAAGAGTVRVAVTQEVTGLTPYSPGIPETLLELVYDKLAAPSPYMADARPWLAQAITPENADGRAWRIHLRKDIRWHDGRPFGAEDVAFTLRYYRDGLANRFTHHVSKTPRLETIEAVDQRTVRVRCADPCPYFDRVTAADLPILPAHVWRNVKNPHRYDGPVIGTGPYRVAALAPARYLELRANSDYFGGLPRVERVQVSFIRNPATAFTALRAGELDLVASPVSPEIGDALAREPGVALLGGNPLTAVEMRINFERPPFSNPEFRRALALAVNPDEVVARVTLGYAHRGTLGYPHPDSPWTLPGLSQPSDPKEARSRLDALGFADRDGDGWREDRVGRPLHFSLKVSSSEPLHLRSAEVVAGQLRSAGIALRVEVLDPSRHRALFSTRQFDLMIGEMGPHGTADPDQLVESHLSGYLWKAGRPNAPLDELIARWRRATTADARLQAAFALQRLHSEAPTTIVLYYPHARWAYRPQVYDRWRALPGMGVFHKWSLVAWRVPAAGVLKP